MYVGVDVSSEWLDLASSGRYLGRFGNDLAGVRALVQAVPADAQVVLEPTSTYHQLLVQALGQAGVIYSLINPARTAAFAKVQGKRAKTDRVDARLLAAYGESQDPEPSHAADEAQERLKALRRHREWLEGEAQGARNRLKAAERSPWTPRSVADSLRRTIRELEGEIERIEQDLRASITQQPRWNDAVKLLDSIPGVGWASSVFVLSELPPVARCASAKSWVAFAGVSPALHESGKRLTSRLSRAGAPVIRARLYMPAIVAMRCNPAVSALNERLIAKGKPGKVRALAAMNKLLRLCFGVLKSGKPFDASLHLDPVAP
jgi:transposase